MNVESAVNPNPVPGRVIEDDRVTAPQEMRVRPSPGEKVCSDDHSWTEAYRARNCKSSTRRPEYHKGIIKRNIYLSRIYRLDFNVSPCVGHVAIRVRAQITIVIRLLAH